MRKPLLIILFPLYLSLISLHSAEPAFSINDLSKILANRPLVRCDYVQEKLVFKLKRNFKSQGTLIFSKSQGIVWKTIKPIRSIMILGKNRLVTIDAQGKKSSTDVSSNASFKIFAETMQALFSGDLAILNQNFTYALTGSTKDWRVTFTPLISTLQLAIQSIEIRGSMYLDKVILLEPNGDIVEYSFSNIEYPKELNADEANYYL